MGLLWQRFSQISVYWAVKAPPWWFSTHIFEFAHYTFKWIRKYIFGFLLSSLLRYKFVDMYVMIIDINSFRFEMWQLNFFIFVNRLFNNCYNNVIWNVDTFWNQSTWGYFQMRIFKRFSNRISNVNNAFCLEKFELQEYKKNICINLNLEIWKLHKTFMHFYAIHIFSSF